MGIDIFLENEHTPFSEKYYNNRSAIRLNVEKISPIHFYPTHDESYYYNKSQKYPDHYCSPSYLRSSYNNSGYEQKAAKYQALSIFDIFKPMEPSDRGYKLVPAKEQLLESLALAKYNRDIWYKLDNEQYNLLDLHSEHINRSDYTAKRTRKEIMEYIFHCDKGELPREIVLFDEPMELYGYAHGVIPLLYEYSDSNEQKVHADTNLIVKENIEWYKQMADIIVEFVELALQLDNPVIYISC